MHKLVKHLSSSGGKAEGSRTGRSSGRKKRVNKTPEASDGCLQLSLCLLGGNAGKSSLVQRFLTNAFDSTDETSTVESTSRRSYTIAEQQRLLNLHVPQMDGSRPSSRTVVDMAGLEAIAVSAMLSEYSVDLEILDTSGDLDAYAELRKTWYSRADGFVFVYSVTSRASFDDMRLLFGEWRKIHPTPQMTKASARRSAIGIVIATQADQPPAARQVSRDEGRDFVERFSELSAFYEVSSKTGAGVADAFQDAICFVAAQHPKVLQEAELRKRYKHKVPAKAVSPRPLTNVSDEAFAQELTEKERDEIRSTFRGLAQLRAQGDGDDYDVGTFCAKGESSDENEHAHTAQFMMSALSEMSDWETNLHALERGELTDEMASAFGRYGSKKRTTVPFTQTTEFESSLSLNTPEFQRKAGKSPRERPLCGRCHLTIEPKAGVTMRKFVFHRACFVCSGCGKPFDGTFVGKGTEFYHIECKLQAKAAPVRLSWIPHSDSNLDTPIALTLGSDPQLYQPMPQNLDVDADLNVAVPGYHPLAVLSPVDRGYRPVPGQLQQSVVSASALLSQNSDGAVSGTNHRRSSSIDGLDARVADRRIRSSLAAPKIPVVQTAREERKARPYKTDRHLPKVAAASSEDGRQWVECTAPDGRLFYYDSATKITVWERPAGFGADKSVLKLSAEAVSELRLPMPLDPSFKPSSGDLTLKDALRDPTQVDFFRAFLDQEGGNAELIFIIDTASWKTCLARAGRPTYSDIAAAQAIYDTFLSESGRANPELTSSSAVMGGRKVMVMPEKKAQIKRALLRAQRETNPLPLPADLFDDAHSEVLKRMQRQQFPRFMKSSIYLTMYNSIMQQEPYTLPESLWDEFLVACNGNAADGWRSEGYVKDVNVETKSYSGDPLVYVRGTTTIPLSPKEVYKFSVSTELRGLWEKKMASSRILQRLDERTVIAYMDYRPPKWASFMNNHDFVVLRTERRLPDGTILVLSRSVVHSDQPFRRGHNRGEMHCGGFCLRPEAGGRYTKVTYVNQVQMHGIPRWAEKKYVLKRAMVVSLIRNFVVKQQKLQQAKGLLPIWKNAQLDVNRRKKASDDRQNAKKGITVDEHDNDSEI